MTNPHEEEWKATERGDVVDAEGVVVGVAFGARPQRDERARIFAAAPKMAQALLAFLPENGHTLECGNVTGDDAGCSDECRNARAALRKAGMAL